MQRNLVALLRGNRIARAALLLVLQGTLLSQNASANEFDGGQESVEEPAASAESGASDASVVPPDDEWPVGVDLTDKILSSAGLIDAQHAPAFVAVRWNLLQSLAQADESKVRDVERFAADAAAADIVVIATVMSNEITEHPLEVGLLSLRTTLIVESTTAPPERNEVVLSLRWDGEGTLADPSSAMPHLFDGQKVLMALRRDGEDVRAMGSERIWPIIDGKAIIGTARVPLMVVVTAMGGLQ